MSKWQPSMTSIHTFGIVKQIQILKCVVIASYTYSEMSQLQISK